MIKIHLPYWIPSIIAYVILLCVHGYIYGSNDQMDFMPYAMQIQNPSLFTQDFYVNCINQKFNERFIISHLIALFPLITWKVLFYFIHAICSISLIFGVFTWASKFITSDWLIWLVGLAVFILSYNINLGGNELYYNMVCGSLISKSMGIWALWYAYNSKWIESGVLAVAATYFHPIAGFQVLLLSALLLNTTAAIKYLILTIGLVSPYIFLLVKDLNSDFNAGLFKDIMLLRNPHHFFPLHFGFRNYVLLTPVFLMGTYLWRSLEFKIFKISLVILVGCIAYSVLLVTVPKLAIQTQWFKSTIWLKFFSILAIIQVASHWLNHRIIKKTIISVSILFITIRSIQLYTPGNSNSIFGYNSNIDLALSIKNKSNDHDLYIVSPVFTEFKFYSEQSTYIDWKAIPHNGECLVEWHRRIKLAYGLDQHNIGKLSSINENANTYLLNLTKEQKEQLKSEGVTKIEVLEPGGSGMISIKL